MMWKQSMTISALGNIVTTMPLMLSEKSIVTSLTSSRFSSGIMESILVTSTTVVPLTAATSVPPLPWPSLLERNVNRSLCSIVSSMLSL